MADPAAIAQKFRAKKSVSDLLPPGTPGSRVWCPDKEEGWILRTVKDYDEDSDTLLLRPFETAGDKKKVGLNGKDVTDTFKMSETHPADPSHRQVHTLCLD